jgi:DegV family protein with EDD domain
MVRVAIITDSISCIPSDLIKKYDIRIIPIGLVINRKIYKDTDLSNDEFWKLFYSTKETITTVAVNPAEFKMVFTDLSKSFDSILCVTMSGLLSSTYNSACQAREILKQDQPELRIEVIDSKTATAAEGFVVMEAARAACRENTLSEVVKVAQNMVLKVKFLAALSTLKYLIRGGRAPKAALIGDWLKVKPIVGVTNSSGIVEYLGREHGMDKAVEKMIEMARKLIDPSKPLHLIVQYSDDIPLGEKVKAMMLKQYNCTEFYMTPFTPVMTSQSGPVVAVAFYQ